MSSTDLKDGLRQLIRDSGGIDRVLVALRDIVRDTAHDFPERQGVHLADRYEHLADTIGHCAANAARWFE
jgi:hypothetical protein